MKTGGKPARWKGSDDALRAVQVAFDVEAQVLEAVRCAAFENNLSMPDQVRSLLGLPVTHRPKRPRLTVSLTAADYATLADRYGVPADDVLTIKERVAGELMDFADNR